MTRVSILPMNTPQGSLFCAVSGEHQATGKTAGEALDAISAKLPAQETSSLVVVQNFEADPFWPEERRLELADLMARWRTARDSGGVLTKPDELRLQALVVAELEASAARAAYLADAAGK